ncbi:TasA family protein [Anaeromicrobium sediminis]|uniref:SipW-cognate class signal peptide n=1 Tax=Anaeromicrobium sediminis TaxID=1478221 RepID=A0A267MMD9_9FIRM|nr:TasA family protein [Anaeromicrobium sediminis]PAB59973.1 hypothetical protein CCE28_08450 [Anaeromicrobium sediminis]
MKHKVALTFIAVMLVCMLAGMGTYAWFTSTTTSQDNVFEAGTVDLGISEIPQPLFATEYDDPNYDDEYGVGEWYPGLSVNGRSLRIVNNGTLTARICAVSADMDTFVNPKNNPDAENEFADKMTIIITKGDYVCFRGKLSELLAAPQELTYTKEGETKSIKVSPGLEAELDFEAIMSEKAGNAIQGVSATVDLILYGTQDDDAAVDELLNP